MIIRGRRDIYYLSMYSYSSSTREGEGGLVPHGEFENSKLWNLEIRRGSKLGLWRILNMLFDGLKRALSNGMGYMSLMICLEAQKTADRSSSIFGFRACNEHPKIEDLNL